MEFTSYAIFISLYVWGTFLIINIGGFVLCKHVYYDKVQHRKVFKPETNSKQHKHELKHGIVSTAVFMLAGFFVYFLYKKNLTFIQSELNEFGILYTVLSFFLIHTYHDTYFYWTHRALHDIKFLRKYHVAHHHSKIPTPLAAASFSKVEAAIQAGFYITAAMIIPAHYGMYLFFYLFITWIAAWGHVEFEFWPSSLYRIPYGNTFNSLTHHNLHHYYGKGNYGLYYRFWDELCGTLHPKTYQHFYEVQKNIAASQGKELSVRRPDAQDTKGLFFEQAESFDEDTSIIMSHQSKFYGIKSFEYTMIETIPHAHCDGISALKLHHRDNGKDIHHGPNFKGVPLRFQYNFQYILEAIKEAISLHMRLPFRGFGFKEKDQHQGKVYALSFTPADTNAIISKAKDKGLSVNFLITNAIDLLVAKDVKKTNWAIPMWAPEKKSSIQDSKIYNNATFFEYIPKRHLDENERFQLYKNKKNGPNPLVWDFTFRVLASGLKYPFKALVWFALNAMRRTGAISNLGSYKGNFEGSLIFAPPVLKSNPLSIGILTYNDELVITAHARKDFGPTGEKIQGYLNSLKENLLC